ncbi:hypothetical protein [Paenibacillus nasutitermitis]|uniref:Uncharacterized protein n=1 Tax=Paenibacillus nasutitermitis TaxID=1652958 RepID=A0A917E221_9BACL|nr:hypothetical protein [Paenibacillus nasutitermitis]GGD92391.1 hypothetical protein GCM10010911_58770 [Paenibacillus nasutitermitis]
MNRKWMKYGVVTLAASSLLAPNLILPAASVSAAAQSAISTKIVKLNGSSYLNIRDAHFLMQEKGKVLAFSVAITNNGSTQLDLIDYWLRVKTKSGKSFKSTITEADKTKTTVAPKSTQYLTYYTVVDNQTKITDLNFEVVKWDFSAANYERRLGTIQYPANTTDKIAAFKDTVMLYNNNKLRSAIKQSYITKDANNAYLTINFLMENVGLQSADLSKMNFFIQTESMSVYNVSSNLEGVSVQPKERKIITLHATLPLVVADKPLSFIASLNDDTSKVQLPSGVFALPATKAVAATGAGETRMVYMDGTPINTKTGSAFLTQGSDKNTVSIDYNLTNIGTASIANPNLDYFLVTSSGTSYPLTFTKEENGVLLPKIEKVVTLTGEIPSTIKPESSQLLVKTTATEKEKSYIIGSYYLKSTSQQGSLQSSFVYNNYTIKLNSVGRSPLEDTDVLMANLTITNNSGDSKKVPALSGYFMVNGVKVGTEQKVVALDESVTVAPGASYEAVVYSEIPYTTAIDKITFVSTEPVPDKDGKQLYQFSGQTLSETPVQDIDVPYDVTSIGKRASVKVTRSAVFNGDLKNNFYVELEAVNKEARAALIANLGGYIKDKNGIIVPVQFAEVKEKLSPNGKALVSAWAQISKNFDTTSYQFIIGQAIKAPTETNPGGETGNGTGNGSGTGTGTPTEIPVIVKPVSYTLKGSDGQGTKQGLTGITFGGHTLDLNHVNVYLNVTGEYTVQGLKMLFDYKLSKDKQYDYIAGDHKLLVEFVNKDTLKTTYTKQFALGTPGTDEELLKEAAESTPVTIAFADTEIQSKVQKYEDYTVNIYDVFQNTKLLIATKDLKWFTISE